MWARQVTQCILCGDNKHLVSLKKMASVVQALQNINDVIDPDKFTQAYLEERNWLRGAAKAREANPIAMMLFMGQHTANTASVDAVNAVVRVSGDPGLLPLYATALEALRVAVNSVSKNVASVVAAYKAVETVTREVTQREWLLARMMAKAQEVRLGNLATVTQPFALLVTSVAVSGYKKDSNSALYGAATKLGTAMKRDSPSMYNWWSLGKEDASYGPSSGQIMAAIADDSDNWW